MHNNNGQDVGVLAITITSTIQNVPIGIQSGPNRDPINCLGAEPIGLGFHATSHTHKGGRTCSVTTIW